MSAASSAIMLPGWGANASAWDSLKKASPDLTAAEVVDWAKALTQPDWRLGKRILVGWSLGAMLALQAAAENPETIDALILISGCARFCADGDCPGADRRALRAMQARLFRGREAVMRDFASLCFAPDGNKMDEAEYLRQAASFSADELALGLQALAKLDLREALGKLNMPVLLIHGQDDKIIPAACSSWLAERLSKSCLKNLPGKGHALPFTSAKEIAAAIGGFLNASVSGEESTGKDKSICVSASPDPRPSALKNSSPSGVAENFSAAAQRYDAWALAQAEIAKGLAKRLLPQAGMGLMVDLGCGTGLLSKELLEIFPQASLLGLDIAEGMIKACSQRQEWAGRARFAVADAANHENMTADCSLIACSCAAQWFASPVEILTQWAEKLLPGGKLACALIAEGSFHELAEAARLAGCQPLPGLQFWRKEDSQALAKASGLRIILQEEEDVAAPYSSAREAVRSFKQIGAAIPGRKNFLTPAQARRLLQHYPISNSNHAALVTYRVNYLILEK